MAKEGLQMTLPSCLGIIDALALIDAVFSQEIYRPQILHLATGLGYLARCSRGIIEES